MSFLKRTVLSEPIAEAREKRGRDRPAKVQDLLPFPAADPEAGDFENSLGDAALGLRLYQMNMEFNGIRVNCFREERSGAILLPLEACARLVRQDLKQFAAYDFNVRSKVTGKGINTIIVHYTPIEGAEDEHEAIQAVAEKWLGAMYNRLSKLVVKKPPILYKGQKVFLDSHEIVFVKEKAK